MGLGMRSGDNMGVSIVSSHLGRRVSANHPIPDRQNAPDDDKIAHHYNHLPFAGDACSINQSPRPTPPGLPERACERERETRLLVGSEKSGDRQPPAMGNQEQPLDA